MVDNTAFLRDVCAVLSEFTIGWKFKPNYAYLFNGDLFVYIKIKEVLISCYCAILYGLE